MNILIFNWRDIKNPNGGGAEILTHEMAKRWVAMGHHVTQFSSLFLNGKRRETIDGVIFIRKGKWWTVHIFAFFYYLKNHKTIDVIMDEVHWFPFFAALYAPRKTVALICEVANKMLFRIYPYPIALIFRYIEKFYLFLYKNVSTMVISQSTANDLLAVGFNKKNITILPMGITVPQKIKAFSKKKKPTLISVGRLNKQKGTFDVVTAFELIHKKVPMSKLWVVGSGEEHFVDQLNQKIINSGLEGAVTLLGFVSEEKKFALLSQSHILISASMQEGWGLTIPEAGLMKTPAVVYDTQGFHDIIDQNKNGILTKKNPKDLAKHVLVLLQNKKNYEKIKNGAKKKAETYSWDKTALSALHTLKVFYDIIR